MDLGIRRNSLQSRRSRTVASRMIADPWNTPRERKARSLRTTKSASFRRTRCWRGLRPSENAREYL